MESLERKPEGPPDLLMLVRHGQSEPNVIQKARDNKTIDQFDPAIVKLIDERPDHMQRLTPYGVHEAQVAGIWEAENGYALSSFDVVYSSFMIRTRETALNLDPTFEFLRPHNAIFEQDWGAYGELSPEEREGVFPRTFRLHEISPMTARLDGGESLLDTMARLRDFNRMVWRKWAGKRVAAIMHGATIVGEEALIERWLPEDYARIRKAKERVIRNLTHVFYSSRNPENPEDTRNHMKWLRVVYPTAPDESPFGGEWIELPDRRFLGSAGLRASIDAVPRLFPEESAAGAAEPVV